jgi:hypothetical protein
MSERQLLESAAKAAGWKRLEWVEQFDDYYNDLAGKPTWGLRVLDIEGPGEDIWNPLTDDRDALRLAVALQMDVFVRAEWVEAVAPMGAPQKVHYERGGREEATRRAIVRAAAALGEQA